MGASHSLSEGGSEGGREGGRKIERDLKAVREEFGGGCCWRHFTLLQVH